nr:MAG TPA: hypothetical protein [Caudoviricetes sp.]
MVSLLEHILTMPALSPSAQINQSPYCQCQSYEAI